MKEVIHSKYAGFFFAGLILTILCAWFSNGFYHIDEHAQVLEFASYKMGITPASGLSWEFHRQVRISLLPWIVFLLCKLLSFIGLYNPFTVVFFLRLLIGLASWYITCRLCLLLSKNMKTAKGEKLFILMSLFMWYVPFLSVRFTSENFTGLCFMFGLYILLRTFDNEKNSIGSYIIAGLLFGTALFVRVAFIYALIGFLIWLIAIKKTKWKYAFILLSGVLLAVVINIGLDSLFYGKLTFTFFNLTNVYVHHSGGMQVNPWWFYIEQFIGRITPPFSLLILGAFILGAYKNRRDPLVWVVVPFILIHFIIRHKELRFLFSVSFLFIYVTALGIDHLLAKKAYLKWHKYIYAAFLIITLPMLICRTLTPANLSVSYSKFVYNHIKGKNISLFVLQNTTAYHTWNPLSPSLFLLQNSDDYSFLMMNNSFYKNPDVKTIPVKNITQLNDSLKTVKSDTAYYLDKSDEVFNTAQTRYQATEVYSFAPAWLAKIITLYTDDKAATWKIYRIIKD